MSSPLLQNGLFQISVHPMCFCGLVVTSLSWGRYTIKRESLRIIPKNLTGGCQYQNMQRDTGKWTAEENWKAEIRMLVWPLAIYHYYDSILLVYGSSQRLNRIFSDCSNCDHFLSKRELQKGLEKHVRYIWVCLLCEWGINLDVLDISSWVRVLFGQFQALWLAAWFIQARHTLVGLRSESGKWDSTWLPKLVWSGTS